jgi:TonB-dependent receptor
MVAAPAFGQANTAEDTGAIVVTGRPIRDSQAAALEFKREAENVLDVISSDTIGRFPDQNLADSLGRLPGVAIERDQGQARFINFRGAPFRWTAIAFDGIDVLGAENGRVPRFDSFPSVITAAVEANKAITPDMPGEAVSGFINIRTFDPFGQDGFRLSAEAGYGEQELGGGPISKYNGRASYSNDRFGVVVFGSHNSREQVTDNRELDLTADASGTLTVNSLDFRNYIVEREDNAYGGRLEYRPTDFMERIFVTTLFSEFIDREQRNQHVFDLEDGAAARRGTLTPGATGYQPLVLVTRMLEQGQYNNSTWTSTLGADFDLAGWFTETRLNYTETENDTFLPIPYSAGGTVAASYDLTDVESPVLTLFQPFSQTPTTAGAISYPANLGIVFASSLATEAYKAKLDAQRDIDLFGANTLLKIGGQYDSRQASGFGAPFAPGSFPASVNIGAFNTGELWETGFSNSIGGVYYDNEALRDAWAQAVGGLTARPAADQAISIDEEIMALYAMATTRFRGGSATYGARVEATDYTSDGPALNTSYQDDYVTFLPSAHLNFDLREDLKLRISGSTGIARPTYTELRASAIVNPTSRSVSGGNPTLKPEKTWGGDVSLEWYYAPASLLSAGAFYRSVDNVIYVDSITIDGGIYLPDAAGQEWTLSGPANGEDGELRGLEFNAIAYLSDILSAESVFDGFGASANLTLLDTEFTTLGGVKFTLPGTSSLIYNASIFYEKYGLSVRVNYQYRDEWLSTTENNSLAEYWDAQERVDASIRYLLPYEPAGAAISIFANANNLTDAVDVRYTGTTITPNQVEAYGRSFLVGLRADF